MSARSLARAAANSYQSRVWATWRRSGVSPETSGTRKANRDSASSIAWSPARTRDRRVLQPALVFRRGVEQPAVAERVRHDVGRDDAVDPIHHEERRTDHRRIALEPAHRRHGHVGQVGDQAEQFELVAQLVGREHRLVGLVGCDPGHELIGVAGAVDVGPVRREQHGLARHAVGRVRADLGHLGTGALGELPAQPGGQAGAQLFGVARREGHVRHVGHLRHVGLGRALAHRLSPRSFPRLTGALTAVREPAAWQHREAGARWRGPVPFVRARARARPGTASPTRGSRERRAGCRRRRCAARSRSCRPGRTHGRRRR